MSHSCIIVCLPSSVTSETVEEALYNALAPFDENKEVEPYRSYEEDEAKDHWFASSMKKSGAWDGESILKWSALAVAYNEQYGDNGSPIRIDAENGRAYTMSTYNHKSRWDYWRIGGRWADRFVIAKDALDRDTIVAEKRAWELKGEPKAIGRCDGGRKRALDFDAQRIAAENREASTWHQLQALVGHLPEAQTWSQFIKRIDAKEITVEEARVLYRQQPRVAAADADKEFRGYIFGCVVEDAARSLDDVRAEARNSTIPAFALLDLDGNWHEKGRMGWFGCSSETDESTAEYRKRANEYLDALDPEAWVITVDVHI